MRELGGAGLLHYEYLLRVRCLLTSPSPLGLTSPTQLPPNHLPLLKIFLLSPPRRTPAQGCTPPLRLMPHAAGTWRPTAKQAAKQEPSHRPRRTRPPALLQAPTRHRTGGLPPSWCTCAPRWCAPLPARRHPFHTPRATATPSTSIPVPASIINPSANPGPRISVLGACAERQARGGGLGRFRLRGRSLSRRLPQS